jgi:hypothetical protein
MITNKIISVLLTAISFLVVPTQIITTLLLGLLVKLSFGLLLIPFSIIWNVLFLGPLLGLSYLFENVLILRPIVSIIGIPLAIIGDTYVALIPSMGETESRYSKMVLCQTFPFTFRYFQFSNNKLKLSSNDVLFKIFAEVSKSKPLGSYLELLIQQNQN